MPDDRITILGAGLAGAATAYALALRGLGPQTLILERETCVGTHASSQNAAMVRALLDEEVLAEWGRRGCIWWNALPPELDAPGLFRRTGSLLLADARSAERLARRVDAARAAGLDAQLLSAAAVRERWPLMGEVPFSCAAFVADDGVADPVALCDAMLAAARRRGAVLRQDCEARVVPAPGGGGARVVGVRDRGGDFVRSTEVVIAAGAWAPELLRGSGASAHGVEPFVRHLAVLGAGGELESAGWDASAPFVWHIDRNAYFRPESGRILASVCDTAPSEACRPELVDGIEERLYEKLAEVYPFLVELGVSRIWAGLRTYRPSHEFLLGPDAKVRGLHRACGLGGHGVTCAGPVGDFVAEGIARSRNAPDEDPVQHVR